MTYRDKLRPWCIIRPQSSVKQMIVARFERRSDAEAYLRILRQILPNACHTIMFDLTSDSPDSYHEDPEA